MLLRVIALFVLAAALAGCVTAEEQRAADEARCLDYGFDPGTSAFADCLLQLDLDRRATARSNMVALDVWSGPVIVYPGYYGRHYHRGPYHYRHYRRHH